VSETVVLDDDLIGSEVYYLHKAVILYIRAEQLTKRKVISGRQKID